MTDGTRRAANVQPHRARRAETDDIAAGNIQMIEILRGERETQLLIREILKAVIAERSRETDH